MKNKKEYQDEYRKKRIHRIIIFANEEYNFLFKSSEKYGKPFSTHVRELALAQARNCFVYPKREDTQMVLNHFRYYNTNLNQIAHVANASFEVSQNDILTIRNNLKEFRSIVQPIYTHPISITSAVRNAAIENPSCIPNIYMVLDELK